MKIYKNAKISVFMLFLLSSLFFPTGKILAQSAPKLPTDACVIAPGETCTQDKDGDGIDDIEIKNVTDITAGGAPRLLTRSLKLKSMGGSQFIESPGIAKYIASTYRYAVSLITILTTIMIIISGVIWTTSAGNPERINSAKQMIARSLTGLVIALGSYTLLRTINPDLVEFRALQVMQIDKAIPEPGPDYSMPTEGAIGLISNPVGLEGIPNISARAGVDARVTAETKEAFTKAMAKLKDYDNGGAVINDALRTPETQHKYLTKQCGIKTLEMIKAEIKKDDPKATATITGNDWKKYSKENPTTLGTPKCPVGYMHLTLEITADSHNYKGPLSGHFGGNALDLSAVNSSSSQPCGGNLSNENEKLSAGVANAKAASGPSVCIGKKQQKLIAAMLENGFCVGLGGSGLREPWHFQIAKEKSSWCITDKTDANLLKLYYVQDPTKN